MTCCNPFAAPWRIRATWVPALIFGLGVLLLLPSIWSETSVTGSDEYSLSLRTPMEMKDRHAWVTPWLDGEPRLRKPPLVYWAILLNYKLFGVNLVSARIWGVLSGAGLAVCASLFSRHLFQRDGLLAGLLALATLGVAVEGRRAMLDLPCALFSTLAVLCFIKWLRPLGSEVQGDDRSRAAAMPHQIVPSGLFLLLSAFLLGFSFLAKGPVGFLFFIAGVGAGLLSFRPANFSAANWWQVPLATLVLASVCLPWPLTMQHLWSERFGRIMGEELAARSFGHWTPGSPLSAWSGALGLVLPWTPLMLGAVYAHFRQLSHERRRESFFLIGWFVLAALPFFFMKSFERYMLALLPAQIVLCAEGLEQNRTAGPPTACPRVSSPRDRADKLSALPGYLLKLSVLLLAALSLVLCLFAWWFKLAVWELVALLLLTAFTIFLLFRSAHPHWLAFASALLFTLALGGLYPRLGINALPESLPGELAHARVELFDPPQPSLLSMRLGRSLQTFNPDLLHPANDSSQGSKMVFVDAAHRQGFFDSVAKHHLHAEEKGHFRTFYSRRAWVRFARPDAQWADWKAAFHARSLDGLKSQFDFYLVSPD